MRLLVCAKKYGLRSKVPNVDTTADSMKEAERPLDMHELSTAFKVLRPLNRLVLAVSGGADSLALMILCHEWLIENSLSLSLYVASVDHGLRPEAKDECALVAELAAQRGLPHATLTWRNNVSASNIQARARDARYQLLSDYAKSLGCRSIAVAHHRDDQAETFIMRLLRGSGVTGLGAMRVKQPVGDLTLVRPLLDIPKSRLLASLRARDLQWIEDPSNHSDAYMRVRMRKLLPQLAQEGGDASRLAATARRLQRADAALDGVASVFFLRHMRPEPGCALSMDPADFMSLEEEFRLRLLRMMLVHVAGPAYPPREEKLIAIDAALLGMRETKIFDKRTMGGCCFHWSDGRVWIYRELGRNPRTILMQNNDPTDWHGLYTIHRPEVDQQLEVKLRDLGADGRALLTEAGLRFPAKATMCGSIPSGLIEALPSIWWENRPQYVIDWPEVASYAGVRVEIEKKNTRSVPNRGPM